MSVTQSGTTRLAWANSTTGTSNFVLDKRLIKIGAGKHNDVVLPCRGVADDHAFVLFTTGNYRLHNLVDGKALRVNGAPVAGTHELRPGDRLTIGEAELTFGSNGSGEAGFEDLFVEALAGRDGEEVSRLFARTVEALGELIAECDIHRLARRLARMIGSVMRCDGVRFLVREGERVSTVAVVPERAGEGRFCKTALDWADRKGHTVLFADVGPTSELPVEESMALKDIGSILCSPLAPRGGEKRGYLYLDRMRGNTPFGPDDAALFERFHSLLESVVDNVRVKQSQADSIRELQRAPHGNADRMLYDCAAMGELLAKGARVAATDVPILLQGETGTGKEVFARTMHDVSPRRDGPFVAVNCGAIPVNLMESEFFGHCKGAFTGATSAKKGYMEAAAGGTLFLDEVGELPLALQVKLLRALQQREILPVGATDTVAVDVRIMAASNRDLETEVAAGRFREDLLFRINVVGLALPPLRERENDVILLAQHFLKRFCVQYAVGERRLSRAAEKALLTHAWPGNVRELENRIKKAVVLCRSALIPPVDLGFSHDGTQSSAVGTMAEVRARAEHRAVVSALSRAGGNISLASRMLDMDRKVLTRLIKKLQIDSSEYRAGS